jgi:hypothetical protein
MKSPTLRINCKLEFIDGFGSFAIYGPEDNADEEFMSKIKTLIDEHIKGRYFNCHRNKKGCDRVFVTVSNYYKNRIGVKDILAKDYQVLIFDVFHLLASNGYKLVFELDEYAVMK